MKRIAILLLSLLTLSGVAAPQTQAGVNDFIISSFDIQYDLSRDADGRSTLKTVETITAVFPDYDQNHGLERSIPTKYDGHNTSLKLESVTDQTGRGLAYTTYGNNGNTVVRIGDADRYVRGAQTYVITYTQRDVTRYFADTARDEFYWDTNGTDWRVATSALSVRLRVDNSIKDSLSGNVSCYQGVLGADTPCTLMQNGADFSVSGANLAPYENITIAVGFKSKTFTAYQPSTLERILGYALLAGLVSIPISIGLFIWLFIRAGRWSNRTKEQQIIIPEYVPPKDISVATAAALVKQPKAVFAAQLLDFAVRGYIKIYETQPKKWWKAAQYDIEISKDISTLKDEEREVLNDIFSTTIVGSRLALSSLRNNTSVYSKISNNDKKLKALIRGDYGLREKDTQKSEWFKKTGWIILALSFVFLNPLLFIVAITSFILGYTLWPLTDKGLALQLYLKGLKEYIKVAEVDRIKMLQSPEGAQKTGGINPDDPAQLVKLYEKVLPYAVLFGQEKEWNARIGDYYETAKSSPDWYSGNNGLFNAAVFSSAMNGFSTAASYSSASSSSSGGSSGGGSSGGGGGGGGGGGW